MYASLLTVLFAEAAVANLDIPQANALAEIVRAATTTAPGLLACASAEAIIGACVNDIPNFTDAPYLVQAECLCCYSTTFVAALYGSCASYIATSAPSYSTEYTGELERRVLASPDL
jgi:hypothetical protein